MSGRCDACFSEYVVARHVLEVEHLEFGRVPRGEEDADGLEVLAGRDVDLLGRCAACRLARSCRSFALFLAAAQLSRAVLLGRSLGL